MRAVIMQAPGNVVVTETERPEIIPLTRSSNSPPPVSVAQTCGHTEAMMTRTTVTWGTNMSAP